MFESTGKAITKRVAKTLYRYIFIPGVYFGVYNNVMNRQTDFVQSATTAYHGVMNFSETSYREAGNTPDANMILNGLRLFVTYPSATTAALGSGFGNALMTGLENAAIWIFRRLSNHSTLIEPVAPADKQYDQVIHIDRGLNKA
jgi:hypothetical protein